MSEPESSVRPTSTQLPSPKSLSEKTCGENKFQLSQMINHDDNENENENDNDCKNNCNNNNNNNNSNNNNHSNSKKFLSSLKSFSIDKSNYKHFTPSSMHFESIINENDNQNIKSSNKFIIDKFISEILNLPKQTITDESVWPYNLQTLNEILRFKVEQEKTKQELIKSEYFSTNLQILKLINLMNIDQNLLPLIFNHDENSVKVLQFKLNELKSSNHSNIHDLDYKHYQFSKDSSFEPKIKPNTKSFEPSELTNTNLTETTTSFDTTLRKKSDSIDKPVHDSKIDYKNGDSKRKYSDTLPSFSQTTESIKSMAGSPILQSPQEEYHRKKSTSSISSKGSKHSPPHYHLQLPTPPQPLSKYSNTSPQIQPRLPPNVYKVYYGPPLNESSSSQHPLHPQATVGATATAATTTTAATASSSSTATSSNSNNSHASNNNPSSSPYSQSYPGGIIYQAQPPPGYVIPQFHYFIPSTPNNDINSSNQSPFMMPPSNMAPIRSTTKPPVPSHQFQINDQDSNKSNIFRSAEIYDDTVVSSKRQKSGSKSTNINFMITTPKNPPARKYNNPHNKDK